MTVNTVDSIAEFVTNGVTTNYPFYFKFLANEDLVVTYINPQGVSTQLVLGTNYTAHGAGNDDGGSIVTVAALAGPGQLVVSREMVAYQQTSLRNQGKFLAETHEDVFDRLTMLVQQGLAFARRALSRKPGKDFFDAENRNVSNLADPVALQDAVTRKWTQQYVGGLLQTGQGPANSAANILYTDSAGIPAVLQALVGNMIAGDLTITVPGQFAQTAAAMEWLRTKTIVNGARVTIQLTASFTPTRTTNLNHPQGTQISILGSAANPTAIRALAVTPLSFDGFACTGGNSFGLLDNFVVDATSKSEWPLNYSGIVATGNASIGCGPGMWVNNYYYHYVGRDGGNVFADFTNSTNSGDVAYWGFDGGHVRARFAVGQNARDVANSLGSIFLSEYNGTVDCTGAKASGALISGIAALSGGSTRAYDSTSTGNDGDGYLARDTGVIVAHRGTASSNGGYGRSQITSGRVLGDDMVLTGNGLGANRPSAYFDNTTLGARIASSGGHLRIDTGTGGYNTNFHSSGGLIVSLLHTESSVNNVYIAGSAANGPCRLGVSGTDANIDIYLQPKGTGVVRFGKYAATSDVPISGSATIRTDDGVLRKVAIIT